MKSIEFEEQNKTLRKPEGMTEKECGSLPVFSGDGQCISLWVLSWKERIKLFFTGKIWLSVYFGDTQPPVKLSVNKKDMFTK